MGENGFLKTILTIATIISTIVGTYMACRGDISDPPPPPPPPPSTTSINIIYRGNNYYNNICGGICPILLTEFKIGDRVIPTDNTPTSNVGNMPLGEQTYSIKGTILFGTTPTFEAVGIGTIDIVKNATINITWEKNNVGPCKIILTQ